MPRYITVGNTVIDHLVVPDGRKMPSQLGGDAIYSAMGVRVWSQDVGIVSIIGRSFPSEWTDGLASAGIDVSGIKRRAFPINLEGRIIYNPDGSRTWGPPFQEGESAYFMCVNRNKSSVTLNLKTDVGREAVHTLIGKPMYS